MIGERLICQGSRAFKRLLMAGGLRRHAPDRARSVDFGAHALDVSVAVTDAAIEADMMRHLVKASRFEVPVPLVIDTTEPRRG